MNISSPYPFEFHVSRQARDRYQFDDALFASNGNVVFANFHAARLFAQKMNARRNLVDFPEQAMRAGQINAMGLLDEILHLVLHSYRQERSPDVTEQALEWLSERLGADIVDKMLRQFVSDFPPSLVYRHELSVDDYLAGISTLPGRGGIPNREIVLEEILMLWLANMNPALAPYLELFDDSALEKDTVYPQIVAGLRDFFMTQPFFGPEHQNLVEMLRSPAVSVPHSLDGQLEYIRTHWSPMLGKNLFRLLSSLDLIREEHKVIFPGPGPARVVDFHGLEVEAENFSPDREWMPNLVLIAKNAYVWLDQLSKKYRLPISRLDEIPDEELEALERWGFTGLWLIGLWERSTASRTIKQMRGNPDAVASAYSLFEYEVAADLGGDEAYRALRDQAWRHGIRLASDMVPNHMGIDSRWVIEHPDWFISLDYSPFPSYTFNGPNLSWDNRVGLFIEDHYFDNSDAAVVFKRVDFWTGSEKYVYHGNDGTTMPWNDTAQLNYLLPEVREAVIQTILHVARKFPIIRFDAAMTLAKRHYQRLWFPEPGSGGDIPSRAEHGMTKGQFDAAFPEEFWRQVVDRLAEEAPDTLLLAEAFWLMEGYFVRTLGMHRVYNSAFMNMMRDEKNQEYRLVIKNTLEFDPEILKRYVNFMNNPDERTAVDQFGKGDKYFGICIMMATLPGLPMFGHGQIEGFTEKYGMEYHRAYWDEHPDGYLVDRHERDVFPLLRRRRLFAEVENFLMYDFYIPGGVNEDVFAYSNRSGKEISLVLFHNRYAETHGWIHTSAAFMVKSVQGEERALEQSSLAQGLALDNDPQMFVIFRDQIAGLEYLRNCRDVHERGLSFDLGAYQTCVFMDFHQVQDNEWHQYADLADYLAGRGVPSLEEALREIFLRPLLSAFRELVNGGMWKWMLENRSGVEGIPSPELDQVLEDVEQKSVNLLSQIKVLTEGDSDEKVIAGDMRCELEVLLALTGWVSRLSAHSDPELGEAFTYLLDGPRGIPVGSADPMLWGTLLGWLFTHRLGQVLDPDEVRYPEHSRSWIDEWLLGKLISATIKELGADDGKAGRSLAMIKLLCTHLALFHFPEESSMSTALLLQTWLGEADVQIFISINRHKGILWFNQESFEDLVWYMYALSSVEILAERSSLAEEDAPGADENAVQRLLRGYAVVKELLSALKASDFQVEKLLKSPRRKIAAGKEKTSGPDGQP